jgi:hypothetical protein
MSETGFRRLACAALMLGLLGALGACGKRSSLSAPPGTTSNFPRQYPNPSMFPHPDLTHGTQTKEAQPPERPPQSSPIDSGSTTGPGMESVQPK